MRKPHAKFLSVMVMRPLELAAWLVIVLIFAASALSRHTATAEAGFAGVRSARVDINAATVDELTSLPGMSRRRANAVVAARVKGGRIGSLEALAKVPGFTLAYVRRIEALIDCGAGFQPASPR